MKVPDVSRTKGSFGVGSAPGWSEGKGAAGGSDTLAGGLVAGLFL